MLIVHVATKYLYIRMVSYTDLKRTQINIWKLWTIKHSASDKWGADYGDFKVYLMNIHPKR